jgi:acyl-coenzyme A thioesterase 13
MPVEQIHLNLNSTLHGGVIATLVDVCGSAAIALVNDGNVGVSSDISVSYLNPAKVGSLLEIIPKCDKKGRNLAFSTVEIYANGKIIARGSHTKFVAKL